MSTQNGKLLKPRLGIKFQVGRKGYRGNLEGHFIKSDTNVSLNRGGVKGGSVDSLSHA